MNQIYDVTSAEVAELIRESVSTPTTNTAAGPYNENDKDNLAKVLYGKFPYCNAFLSTLGGKDNSTIFIRVSTTDKDKWRHNIFQNSVWAIYGLRTGGVLEKVSGSKQWGSRKTTIKSFNDVLDKLRAWYPKTTVTESNQDVRNVAKAFRRNENNNNHTENALLLAKAFGTDAEIDDAETAMAMRGNGWNPSNFKQELARKKAEAIVRKYYPKIAKLTESDNVVDIYRGFEIRTMNTYSTPYFYIQQEPIKSQRTSLKAIKSWIDKAITSGKIRGSFDIAAKKKLTEDLSDIGQLLIGLGNGAYIVIDAIKNNLGIETAKKVQSNYELQALKDKANKRKGVTPEQKAEAKAALKKYVDTDARWKQVMVTYNKLAESATKL